jgi:putative endonuclease
MKGFVYILKSIKCGEYYVGSSEDVKRRLSQHNSGNVKATELKRPYRLVFQHEFKDIYEAKKIERKIKNWKRKDFIEKIVRDGFIKNVRA